MERTGIKAEGAVSGQGLPEASQALLKDGTAAHSSSEEASSKEPLITPSMAAPQHKLTKSKTSGKEVDATIIP